MSKKNGEQFMSISDELDRAAFENIPLSREKVGELVERDLQMCFLLLHELLSNNEVKNAVIDTLYRRYESKLAKDESE